MLIIENDMYFCPEELVHHVGVLILELLTSFVNNIGLSFDRKGKLNFFSESTNCDFPAQYAHLRNLLDGQKSLFQIDPWKKNP